MNEIEKLVSQLENCQCGGCENCGDCGCDEVLDHLFMLLDQEISGEQEHRLLRHGANCPNCSERIAAEIRVRKAIRRSCCGESAPASLRVRISQVTVQQYRTS